jgi:hypothetical protein
MSEAMHLIARVRRAQPRNLDVMALCELAERLLLERASNQQSSNISNTSNALSNGRFDKAARMREYMRRRRAAAREASP